MTLRRFAYLVAILWPLQMIVVAGAMFAQTTDRIERQAAVVEAARNTERVLGLSERVIRLEAINADARLQVLARDVAEVKESSKTLQQWAYGILGGVIIQLFLQAVQLRGTPPSRGRG